MVEPSIYDQLAKESFSDLTITQLNAGTSVTAVDQATINYWKGPLTLSRVLEASRTYAGGTLPIPETGAILSAPIAAGDTITIQPQGTEIWRIQAIWCQSTGGDADMIMSLTDGSALVPFDQATITTAGTYLQWATTPGSPPEISNSLYLSVLEGGASNPFTMHIAYYKMGL